jgi:hypothetical protein
MGATEVEVKENAKPFASLDQIVNLVPAVGMLKGRHYVTFRI